VATERGEFYVEPIDYLCLAELLSIIVVHRELVSQSFSSAYPDILSASMIGKGFERLFELADELEKDVPSARDNISTFLARCVVDEGSFLAIVNLLSYLVFGSWTHIYYIFIISALLQSCHPHSCRILWYAISAAISWIIVSACSPASTQVCKVFTIPFNIKIC
jgi:hypothetical protein